MLRLRGGVRGGRGSRRGGVTQHVVAGAYALLHRYAEHTAREHTASAGATGQDTGNHTYIKFKDMPAIWLHKILYFSNSHTLYCYHGQALYVN